jgi:hypothetical protein
VCVILIFALQTGEERVVAAYASFFGEAVLNLRISPPPYKSLGIEKIIVWLFRKQFDGINKTIKLQKSCVYSLNYYKIFGAAHERVLKKYRDILYLSILLHLYGVYTHFIQSLIHLKLRNFTPLPHEMFRPQRAIIRCLVMLKLLHCLKYIYCIYKFTHGMNK